MLSISLTNFMCMQACVCHKKVQLSFPNIFITIISHYGSFFGFHLLFWVRKKCSILCANVSEWNPRNGLLTLSFKKFLCSVFKIVHRKIHSNCNLFFLLSIFISFYFKFKLSMWRKTNADQIATINYLDWWSTECTFYCYQIFTGLCG